jgi:DNA-binding NtrC family response regulator
MGRRGDDEAQDRPSPTEDAGGREVDATVRRFRLAVTVGPDTGLDRLSEGTQMVVGTHPSAGVVLTDRTVSRFHCEIGLQDGVPSVRDLGSRNRTLVDGVPVFHAPLRDGATLELGKTQLRFDLGRDSIRIDLSARERFGAMVGRSSAMRAVFATLEKAAASDITVLLEGETGTGKEVAAEAIHREGPRAEAPLVVLDCGAIPPELMESELFGHERGAFTGADHARLGAFEAAAGGTLFLDEIGELETDLQPKLLRALEQRSFRRVGGSQAIRADVRLIAATSRNLRAEVNAGRFRADLYYRLAVLPVRLPPLRDRVHDLPLLVARLLEELGAADLPAAAALSAPAFLARLARHPWPGNVRELRNHLERSLVLNEPAPLADDGAALSPAVDLDRPFKLARDSWMRAFERRYLDGLLERHHGNVRTAAEAAGVDRVYFYRMLWRHGLK